MNPWDVLARQLTRLGDRIDALPSVREATVTGLSPLEVRFDTDTTGTVAFGTLASGIRVGDRVLTVRLSRYVWVLGARNGGDTGWTTPPLNAGWTPGTETPQYRRIDGVVYFRGRADSTGESQFLFTLPAGFRPGTTRTWFTDANGTSVRAAQFIDGAFGQATTAAVTQWSLSGCPPYPADL